MVTGVWDDPSRTEQAVQGLGNGTKSPFELGPDAAARSLRVARWCGLAVSVTGAVVFAGWLMDVPVAKSVAPGLATMKPNTAACFIFVGIALFLAAAEPSGAGRRRRALAHALAIAAVSLGSLTLLEYLSGISLGIDELFVRDLATAAGSYPGRMAPLTALGFVLTGLALAFGDSGSRRLQSGAQLLTLSAMAIALVAIVGYCYSALSFYRIASFTSMALHTSVALFLVSTGVLLAKPNRGVVRLILSPGSGGIMARRLLPVSILAPIVVGLLRLKGQRAGLFGTEVGVGLFVITVLVILLCVVYTTAEELERMEAGRNAAERRYRDLVEMAPIGIYRSSSEGRYLSVNAACARILGYDSVEEVMRLDINESVYFAPSERRALMADVARQNRSGGAISFEIRLKRRDGSPVWVRQMARVVKDADGVPRFFDGFALDIQEQKQAEEALRQSEERFRRTFSSSPAGMALSEAKSGRFLDVNERLASLYECEREELIGRTSLELGLWADPSARAAMLEDLEANRPVRNLDVTLRTKAGASRFVLMSVEPIQLGDERVLLSVIQDITERRLLEEQFRQAQKMDAIGQLAGGVAHDFNNLLTAILGYADLAAHPDTSELLAESIEEIRKAAERAASLTRQLLAFSRRQVLEPKVLDVNTLVEDLRRMLSRLIGENVTLAVAPASDVGRIRADAGQVEQVIVNLVVNARDAMPDGGRVTIETANVELDEAYAQRHSEVQPGRYVVVSISDTGIGMDAATQARLFEPFFTTKEKGKGTGLGLATVYGIVKQSEGTIWVYSEPGRGSTFKVYFPRVDAPAAAPETASQVFASLHGTETILLAEDEEAVRRLARRILETRGYKVLEAGTGAKALETAGSSEGAVDLLLTDLVMPDMPGTVIAERLARIRPGVKILMMSGYTDDAVVRAGLLEQGWLFLQKPFTAEALLRRVREALA